VGRFAGVASLLSNAYLKRRKFNSRSPGRLGIQTVTVREWAFSSSTPRLSISLNYGVLWAAHLTHHSSFNPNCTWRELVAVAVITPAVGDGSPLAAAYTTAFGVLKFA